HFGYTSNLSNPSFRNLCKRLTVFKNTRYGRSQELENCLIVMYFRLNYDYQEKDSFFALNYSANVCEYLVMK
ncbi:hypothetical protein, partial [Pedobacter antarcticus]|uniref:hypothetical protein n=1 Tax=Pedobacter antarcticus TaxID=34086 RepID=UPI001F3188EA